MRLIVLVIASDNLPIYATHQSLWRLYATSHPDVKVYFVRQSEAVVDTHIEGDTIWSSGKEATERVFEKTIEAFKIILPTSYDYIVRTNLSSVWNFQKLLDFCKTLPKEKTFCGVLGNPGISGAGMILSPDVVQLLVDNRNSIDRCMWDDVDFGKIAARCAISSIPGSRWNLYSRQDVDSCWNLGYHYYLKDMRTGNRNVANEIDVMRYLISKIYPRESGL